MAYDDPSALSDEHVGRRVILGGTQRAIGFVVASLMTAGSAIVLLRYLSVSAFGRYGTVMALVGIVYGVSEMGLTLTGTRELALVSSREEGRALLAHIIGLRIVATGGGGLAAVGFAWAAGYSGDMVAGTALAGCGVLLQSVQAAILLPLSVQLRNGVLAVNQLLTQALLLGGFVALALTHSGLVPFFAVQILVGVALLAAVPLMVHRHDLVAPAWELNSMVRLGRTALPLAVGTVLGILYLRILVVVMSLISDRPQQIGYFVTSTRVLELVGGIPFLVVGVVLPVLTVAGRDDPNRMVTMTGRVAWAMLILGVLTALVCWTLATPIVTLLGGARYGGAGEVLGLQCFAVITVFVGAAWQPALMGLGQLRALAMSLATGLVVVAVAGVTLIPEFQAMGAAAAAVIGDVALVAALYVALRRAAPAQWLPVGPSLRIAVAAAAAVGIGFVPGLPTPARAVVVVGVFLAAVLVLRALPGEFVHLLRLGTVLGR